LLLVIERALDAGLMNMDKFIDINVGEYTVVVWKYALGFLLKE
jgi:hypothetical protein